MAAIGSNLQLVFVSDLHLGATPPSASAPYVAGFARFLDHLRDRASERRACRLVLLGDALDFLKVRASPDEPNRRPENSKKSAISKLNELARQEPLFFVALGRFAASGLRIDIVAGNHDIDLVRPAAQQRLRQLVEQASGCARAGQQIHFHPWIYHVPGIVYAEHGQQHHDINSFATVLQPYVPGDGERLNLPFAAHLPAPGRPAPLRWVRGTTGVGMSVVRHVAGSRSPDRARRRMEYREQVLARYAAEVDLDHAAVVAIDRLAEVSLASVATRLVRKAFAARRTPGRPTQQGGYLHEAALAIHRILASGGTTVPFYVFGHTHIAEKFPLAPGALSPQYLNSGTWSSQLPAGTAPGDSAPLLTFVQIRTGDGATGPTGEVLRWDGEAHRVRPLATSSK